MFAINHASTALMIKRRYPSVTIWPILISVQLMELAWVVLNYIGVERTTTESTVRTVADVHLAYMPYSHSVITACAAAVIAWLVIEKRFHRVLLGRAVGIGIISHLILDLLTHAHDISLAPGIQQIHLGLGLYNSAPLAAFTLELGYGILCWYIYKGSKQLLGLIVVGNLANLSFFSASISGPEESLAGHPMRIVTIMLIQIVVTLILVGLFARRRRSYAIDKTVPLQIDGTTQRVRLCAEKGGLPPLLIVQAGPGLSLLNEVGKFQKLLELEQNFLVAYWDQRGCGNAALQDTQSISLETQVSDLCFVIRWLAEETGQKLVVLGISIGATIALQAAVREADKIKFIVAASIDTDIPSSDRAVFSFLKESSVQPGRKKIARLIRKLEPPPHIDVKQFQLRARMLMELGGIEYGKRFREVIGSSLFSLLRIYGLFGTVITLRNMNAIARKLLPEIAKLNLFVNWIQPPVPVQYIFGGSDPLITPSMVEKLSGVMAETDSIMTVPNAGHMVHFDKPDIIRSIIVKANSMQNGAPLRVISEAI